MKIFGWAIAFGVILFLGDRGLSWVLQQLLLNSDFRYVRLYDGSIEADILIVGNSRGVNGFYQPGMEERLDKRVYNISYNGLRMDIARVLIEDYLEYNPAPQTLIIEASMLTKAFPELLEDFKPFARPGTHLYQLFRQEFPQQAFFTRLSHLYRYNSLLYLRSLYYWRRTDQAWINTGQISDQQITALQDFSGTELDYLDELVSDLNEVQRICDKKGIQLRIILTPYYPAYAEKISNRLMWIKEINEQLVGNKIQDYATAIPGDAFYADWVHLNRQGGMKFLDMLIANGEIN